MTQELYELTNTQFENLLKNRPELQQFYLTGELYKISRTATRLVELGVLDDESDSMNEALVNLAENLSLWKILERAERVREQKGGKAYYE